MQEEGASLATSTLLHLLLLPLQLLPKAVASSVLGTASDTHSHHVSVIPPGWVSSDSQASYSQLPATVPQYPGDAPLYSSPENIPTQRATEAKSNPLWIPLWVPSIMFSLSPKVFFMVLLTSLLILSDTDNDSFTSGDQVGATFRPRDTGGCLDVFSVSQLGEEEGLFLATSVQRPGLLLNILRARTFP